MNINDKVKNKNNGIILSITSVDIVKNHPVDITVYTLSDETKWSEYLLNFHYVKVGN